MQKMIKDLQNKMVTPDHMLEEAEKIKLKAKREM